MPKVNALIHVRQTKRQTLLMFSIKILAYLRLINIETAAKVVQWAASKGWLCQYKINNGKWGKLAFDFDYEIVKSENKC